MKGPSEPSRWSEGAEDAPPELARLLRNAREDLPGPRELLALGIALPPSLGGGAGTGAGAAGAKTAAVAKAGAVGVTTKVTAAALLAMATGVALYATRSEEPGKPPAARSAPLPAPVIQSEAQVSDSSVEDVPLMEATGSSSAAPSEADGPAAESRSVRNAPRGPAEELPLLQQARRALAKEPGRALALVRRHEREFPRGRYVQEREVIRIEALRRLGKQDEADRLGEQFKQRFPGSAHKSKLDRDGQ